MYRPQPKHSAYSLVELLVVIGIVVLLLAILLPALRRARESARQVVCASNMRQLAAAYAMYAKNNLGRPPSPARSDILFPDDWVFWQEPPFGYRSINDSALAPYLGAKGPTLRAVFRCPSDPLTHTGYPLSYSMNTGLWRVYWQKLPRLPITMVRHPSEKALFYDEDDHADDGAFWYQNSDNLTDRHNGKGNIAFFDGHVEAEFPSFAHELRFNDPQY